jgi:hypothetical protein
MVAIIAIGVVLIRLAKAGSEAASRHFRAELIWTVLFAVDGGLSIYTCYLSDRATRLDPQDTWADVCRGNARAEIKDYGKAIGD